MSEEQQTNGLDSTTVNRFAGEIFQSWKRTRDIREEAKEKIRPDLENEVEHRQGLYEAAENAGLPLSALKLEVGRQKLDWENELKKKAREAKAGEDIVDLADMMRELLGGEKGLSGLPLGEAAVSAASDGEADLRGNRQREREAQRQADAEANLGGMSADSAKKDKAKRAGRKPKAGAVPLVGEDDGTAPKTGSEHETAGLH